MNLGLMPVTGIPLPFISYGGSALIVSAIALGILNNISWQVKTLRF
jgi:rod shape determining protein RodA